MMVLYTASRFRKAEGVEDAPTFIAYVYAGHVIPATMNEKLQTHIAALLTALETDEELHDWLFLPASARKEVAHVLKQWQKPLEANYYRAPTVRRAVKTRIQRDRMKGQAMFGIVSDIPKDFENDRKSFDDFGVLFPSKTFAERRDPRLVALMRQYEGGSEEAKKQLADHIDATWVTNVTLLDFDSVETTRKRDDAYNRDTSVPGNMCRPIFSDEEKVPSIESDPLELAQMLPPCAAGVGVLEMVGSFFDAIAIVLVQLSPRLKIEALVGEMADTMDRLRWGCLESRSRPSGGIDPSTFPRAYDRIHMSNIP